MTRRAIAHNAGLAFVAVVATSFAMTSFVTADTITNTGPHAPNKINSKIENKCDIETDNDIRIENENKQKAESGEVSVTGRDHDEEHYKPSETDLSQAAEPELLSDASEDGKPSSDESDMQQSSGEHEHGDNQHVKNIRTGDAINSSETRFNIEIETENECLPKHKMKSPGIHKPSQAVKPSTQKKVAPRAISGAGAAFVGQAGPQAQQFKQPVHQTAPPAPHPAPVNEIHKEISNNVHITTNNSVSISNTNHQSATSGDANVHNNGHVGNVQTGDAINENTTKASVSIQTSN